MTIQAQDGFEGFEAGQLWKTESGFILITEEGRRLVCYKKLRDPNQRTAVTNLIRPEALVAYLRDVRGELVPATCLNLSREEARSEDARKSV